MCISGIFGTHQLKGWIAIFDEGNYVNFIYSSKALIRVCKRRAQGVGLNRTIYFVEEKNIISVLVMAISMDREASVYIGLVTAVAYGVASMAMVFINKAVLMQFSYSMTLLTLQQLVTTLLIYFGRAFGFTQARPLTLNTAKRLLPLSIFYNANVAFALASLKGVNIPMYIALKRLTPLAVLIAGILSGKGKPPLQVSLSVILTAVGVMIAALGDFTFDFFGYTLALTSVFFQTAYLVLVEKSAAEDGLSSVELMYYNSFLSLPVLVFLITITGEFPLAVALLTAKLESLTFCVVLILSLIMGIVLNFTMFLCTIVNSALTTTIVGVLKGVGSTTLGFVLLGGVEVHGLNVIGLVINTIGGIWYSLAKFWQKKNKPLLVRWKTPPKETDAKN